MLIEKNGKKLLETEVNGENEEGLTDRSLLDMENIWNFINTADIADIYKVLSRQIKYNTAISEEVDAGILGYNMYIRGRQFRAKDGIVTKGADATICNIGRLGKDGMKETNDEIISIMVGNCRSKSKRINQQSILSHMPFKILYQQKKRALSFVA